MNEQFVAALQGRLEKVGAPERYLDFLSHAMETTGESEAALRVADRLYDQAPYDPPDAQQQGALDLFRESRTPDRTSVELTRVGGQPAALVSAEVPLEAAQVMVEKEIGTAVSLEPIQARTDGRALYRIRPR